MWDDLARRGLKVRPWDGTKPRARMRSSAFSASFSTTMNTLTRELRILGATQVVVELDIRERDLRLDGYPRVDARALSPVVAISFASKHGPLRYVCAEFRHWHDNIRAIALGLEALRAVDRYGISRRGEQYRGYRELPMSTSDALERMTEEQAVEVIVRASGGDYAAEDIASDGPHLRGAILAAQWRTHPDKGGDPDEFVKVQRAAEILRAAVPA